MSSIRPVFGLTVLVAALPASAATTYDLVSDWAPGANPNGTWAYLSGSAILPYWPTMAPLGGAGGFAPSADVGTFLPVFWRPGAAGTDVFVHSYDGFNGGAASGEAVLQWTSPVTGTIDLSGYFYYAHAPLQRSNDVTVKLGSTQLLAVTTSYVQYQDYANRYSFSFDDLAVSAGDTLLISFVRSPGYAPGTVTGMDVTVVAQAVPEPGTWALMAGGLGLVGWLARRGRTGS